LEHGIPFGLFLLSNNFDKILFIGWMKKRLLY
jgi:hypothetical protein